LFLFVVYAFPKFFLVIYSLLGALM